MLTRYSIQRIKDLGGSVREKKAVNQSVNSKSKNYGKVLVVASTTLLSLPSVLAVVFIVATIRGFIISVED